MAKPLKIEQLKLQAVVAAGLAAGKNPQQIADDCTRKAKEPISNMAVRRYLELAGAEQATPVQKQTAVSRRTREKASSNAAELARISAREIDLIELQYRTTEALVKKFEWVLDLPELFDSRMNELADKLKTSDPGLDLEGLARWQIGFREDMRRNIVNVTSLNRELRENSKFIMVIREKAYEYTLYEEYLYLFMDVFRKAAPDAYEIATNQVAANPRMQRIVEQQNQLRGGETG
jgi:hypothetical protein